MRRRGLFRNNKNLEYPIDNLLAYYRGDSFNDISGNNRHASNNGVQIVDGKYYYEATNDFMNLFPSNLIGEDDITISMKVTLSSISLASFSNRFLTMYKTSNFSYLFVGIHEEDSVYGYFGRTPAVETAVNIEEEIHVLVELVGSLGRLEVNGNFVGEQNNVVVRNALVSTPIKSGRDSSGFIGYKRDLVFWNSLLTPQEKNIVINNSL